MSSLPCRAVSENYQPVKLGEDTSWSIILSKGGVVELEAIINPDRLEPLNTFCCVAVPQGGTPAPSLRAIPSYCIRRIEHEKDILYYYFRPFGSEII